MVETRSTIPRISMDGHERSLRSRLTQITSGEGFMHGSLLVRYRRCGKPNCKCVRGQRHRSVFVYFKQNGRTRQLYVPKGWEPQVRQWLQNHKTMRKLIRELEELHWQKVRPLPK